jgi:cell division protein FtsL
MRNWVLLTAIVALIVTGSSVFVIAQRMHHTQTELASLRRETQKERESLRVLQAEWTYLNNPARLERLATSLFALKPVDGKQYVALNNVPTIKDMQRIETAQVDVARDRNGYKVTEKSVAVDDSQVANVQLVHAPVAMPPVMQAMPASLVVGGIE